jgi:hypothetical protein
MLGLKVICAAVLAREPPLQGAAPKGSRDRAQDKGGDVGWHPQARGRRHHASPP